MRLSRDFKQPALKKALSIAAFVAIGVYVVWMSVVDFWHMDGVLYGLVHSGTDSGIWIPKHPDGISEFFISQWRHYLVQNGRFFCHTIVSAFVIAKSHWLFAIFNALAWELNLLALVRLSGIRLKECLGRPEAIWFALATLIPCYTMGFDPAFQINYVWMTGMSLWFIILFFSNKNPGILTLAGIFLYSFLSGQGHEIISLCVSIGLLVWILARRLKASPLQWTAMIGYWLGSATVGLAPGILNRLHQTPVQTIYFVSMEFYYLALTILLPFCIALLYRKQFATMLSEKSRKNILIISAIAMNLIFQVCSLYQFGIRSATIASTLALALMLNLLYGKRLMKYIFALFLISGAVTVRNEICFETDTRAYYDEVYRQADRNLGGLIVMPDSLLTRYGMLTDTKFIDLDLEARFGKKPTPVEIIPESLSKFPARCDTNYVERVGVNRYLLIQSATRPAKFIIHKEILGGIMKWPDRELDLSDPELDIRVRSGYIPRSAYYISPVYDGFVKVDIEMILPEESETKTPAKAK